MKKTIDIGLWVVASATGIFFAMQLGDSVLVDGRIIPYTNDSFYHAARILDTIGDRGFYQFDEMMHVPEGSWVSWPWGYDYLMAGLARLVLWIRPATDAMSVLAFVPVAWILANVALLIAIANRIELRAEFKVCAVISFGMLPLTQSLHGLGQIDHHYMELFFVLLTTLIAMKLLRSQQNSLLAAALGACLAIAQIMHHGLFILQLPVLATLLLLWLKGQLLPRQSLFVLAAALCAATVLVSLPSETFRNLHFEMSTLSLFHVYAAACSALIIAFLAILPSNAKSILALAALGIVLAIPATAEIILGTNFVTGNLAAVGNILEMQSPFKMMRGGYGVFNTAGSYSLLIFIVPLFILASIWQLSRQQNAVRTAYFVFAVFGLGLMLFQYRLNYFGLAFMLLTGFVLLQRLPVVEALDNRSGAVAAVIAVGILFWPPLSGALFTQYPLGGDYYYALSRPLLLELSDRCARNPGIALAPPQIGHYIRYHTDCSVISNNFLLTDLHSQKVRETNYLFAIPADILATGGSGISYVIAIVGDTHHMQDGMLVPKNLGDIRDRNPQLIRDLVFPQQPSDHVETVMEVTVDVSTRTKLKIAGLYELRATGE